MDDLNDKYRRGVAGHSLETAGVLLHQFDTIDSYDPSKANGPSWVLSTESPQWSDRISAVLLNEQLRNAHSVNPLYSDVTAGVVFHPEFVDVLCSYSSDGGSQHVKCFPPGRSTSCTPGCSNTALGPRSAHKAWWGVREVGAMLGEQLREANRGAEKRYNEIILDAFEFRKNLPDAIAAVFFIGTDAHMHCNSENHWAKAYGHCEDYARKAHADFLRRYDKTADDVPLLRLDVHTKVESPFSLADDPWSDPLVVSGGEIVDVVCLTRLRASDVQGTDPSCRPQLWVYNGQGEMDSVQKTKPTTPGKNVRWDDELICVSLAPRPDRRVCFDIRDANAARSEGPGNDKGGGGDDDDDEPDRDLLHFGCATITGRSVGKSMEAELGDYAKSGHRAEAVVRFEVRRFGAPASG